MSEPAITSKQYKYKIITSITDVPYLLLENAVNVSYHVYSQMIKKCFPSYCVYTKRLYSFPLLLCLNRGDPRVLSHYVCLYASNTSLHWYFAYKQLIQVFH